MAHPLFSIVIPTRERPDTLEKCLASCLDQDFDDYEIIVCDNAGTPATRQVVDAANSARIVYLRAPEPLAMSANWELAVSAAKGEYVTVIGDDDGLMPYALRELARIIRDNEPLDAVQWRCAHYHWPTIRIPEEANYLLIPLSRDIAIRDGRTELRRASLGKIGYDKLPMINTAIVRRNIIEEHRRRTGLIFGGLYPDVYSAYAFAYLCTRYASTTVPMHVAGLAGRSNGVAALMETGTSDVSKEFYSLQQAAGFTRHATIPDYELFPVHADDSFQQAKARLFANDDTLVLDRQAMLMRYLAAIPDLGAEERLRIRGLIRASVADQPELQAWFDTSAPDLPPCKPFRLKPAHFGWDGEFLHLDTKRFGVTDICGAVTLTANILQIEQSGIVFDVQVLSEAMRELQSTLIERSKTLETVLADQQGIRTALVERSQALEVTLADLIETRALLVERTRALEATLADLVATRALLVERTPKR
jgi:glycosyltransferase involved in cell wall biosynthesis